MKLTPPKYKVLRDELLSSLRTGEFVAGQRLPSERDLVVRFKVTHMTVRQAIAELVDLELLERRARQGVYVRHHSQEKLSTITLNLICPVSDNSIATEFLKFGTQIAAQRGWRTRITRSQQGYERPLVKAIQSGEPSLIFLDLPGLSPSLHEAMVQANGHAAMIGNRFDNPAVPSVLADDKLAVEMAVEHLRRAGHENIAMVVMYPEHPVVKMQVAAWKDCFADHVPASVLERRLINVSIADFQNAADAGNEAVSRYLQQPDADVTAMICINDMLVFGAMFACQKMGRRVPEDTSFICTLDSYVMKFLPPGITVIDICIEHQVSKAMDMVDAAVTGSLPTEKRFCLIKPRLIERSSVRRANQR